MFSNYLGNHFVPHGNFRSATQRCLRVSLNQCCILFCFNHTGDRCPQCDTFLQVGVLVSSSFYTEEVWFVSWSLSRGLNLELREMMGMYDFPGDVTNLVDCSICSQGACQGDKGQTRCRLFFFSVVALMFAPSVGTMLDGEHAFATSGGTARQRRQRRSRAFRRFVPWSSKMEVAAALHYTRQRTSMTSAVTQTRATHLILPMRPTPRPL